MINFKNSSIDILTEVSVENLKPCLDVIGDYVKNLRQNGFNKEQFEKELEKDEYYWQTKVNTPQYINNGLTKYRFYGRFIEDKEIHAMVQSLTLDEVNQTMRQIFDNAKIQVFVYGNATKKDLYTIKQIQKKFN